MSKAVNKNKSLAIKSILHCMDLPDSKESNNEVDAGILVVQEYFNEVPKQRRIEEAEQIIRSLELKIDSLESRIRYDIARSIVQTALNRAGV